MEMLAIALNDINVSKQHSHIEREKNSIGLIHQKMTDRFKVVHKLPEKTDSVENMFAYADAYGKIRFGYFGARFKEQTTDYQNSFAAAVGGIMGIKSAEYKGVSFKAAAYISQDLPFLYDTAQRSLDFYSTQGKSYTYLAEANLHYVLEDVEAIVGRFAIDMPYANTDDLRMSQNTFEGAWGQIKYSDTLSTQFFYIQRWAGFDSQDEDSNATQNEFKKLVEGGRGLVGASLIYEYAQESEASVWLHYIDKMASIGYAEINGLYDVDDAIHFDYGLQYAYIREEENSNVDGQVVGAMFIGHYNEFFLGLAANGAFVKPGKYVTDGFGGGPYFTSLDEATIAFASETSPGEDIEMYRTSLGYDKEEWYSSFEYAYGYMGCNSNSIHEHDLIYTYEKEKKWQAQVVFANFSMRDSDNRLNRIVARIDYNF